MELTLSPDIELEAIQELTARRRDEKAPALLLKCLKVAARYVVEGPLGFVATRMTRWVEGRNARIANHLRWFPQAIADLKSRVQQTGVPAGEELRHTLDDLIDQIDESAPQLIALAELLKPASALRRAVHRSASLLLEVKASALEMKRAGQLEAPPHEITRRIEMAQATMLASSSRPAASARGERDPELLAQAKAVADRRARATATAD